MNGEWVAAYYPSDILDDQRIKTLFCLLYDRVVLHFPIAHMGCGGGAGVSGIYSDDPLVTEGVLDLREDFLLDDIEGDFSLGHPWGTPEEFEKYHNLNVAGLALKCCEQEGAVPATSRPDAPIPISLISQLNFDRAVDIQASALAIQSLDLVLPQFGTLESSDILKARDYLKDQLGPFRSAMYSLAPKVRSALDSGASLNEVILEAKYISQTDIIPRLDDLKRKLEKERGLFWRKLLMKVAGHAPSILLNWVSSSTIAALIETASLAGDIGSLAIENEQLKSHLLQGGGLGYLLSASKLVSNLR